MNTKIYLYKCIPLIMYLKFFKLYSMHICLDLSLFIYNYELHIIVQWLYIFIQFPSFE